MREGIGLRTRNKLHAIIFRDGSGSILSRRFRSPGSALSRGVVLIKGVNCGIGEITACLEANRECDFKNQDHIYES